MRIQVSYRDAIAKIDSCLKEGSDLRDFLIEDYWEHYEAAERARDERKKKEIEDIENRKNLAPVVQLMLEANRFNQMIADDRVDVSAEVIESYEEKFRKWYSDSLSALKQIFSDYTPIYEFKVARRPREFEQPGLFGPLAGSRKHDELLDLVSGKIDTLVAFYKALSRYARTPLHYIPDKAQIWFYDVMIQLTPDSNEASLCEFMFDFGIGEWQEVIDVADFVLGKETDVKDVNKKVINVLNELNRKANATFGFKILKSREKKMIALTLPPKFVAEGF